MPCSETHERTAAANQDLTATPEIEIAALLSMNLPRIKD